jgi:hypothetical protein
MTRVGQQNPSRGRWDLGAGDAESVLAEAHIGGLAGGVAAGWIFRDRRPKPAKRVPATGTAGLNFPGTQPGATRRPGDAGSAP